MREMITTFYNNQDTSKNILKAHTFGIPIKNHGKSMEMKNKVSNVEQNFTFENVNDKKKIPLPGYVDPNMTV